MFQGMTVAATGSQGTDTSIYFKLCSGFQAGLWHLSLYCLRVLVHKEQSTGGVWKAVMMKKSCLTKENITNGGTRILQVPLASSINIS